MEPGDSWAPSLKATKRRGPAKLQAYLGLCAVAADGVEGGRSEGRSPERASQGGRAEAHSRGHREGRLGWAGWMGWRSEGD